MQTSHGRSIAALVAVMAAPSFVMQSASGREGALGSNGPRGLGGNATIKAGRPGNKISVSDIVGIDNHQDGSLIIYTDGNT